MITTDEVYKIGTLTRTHGVHGELSFAFTDDVWDRADADYLVLMVDGILVPFFLQEYRFRSQNVALVHFVDYDDATRAEELVGMDVYFPHALTPDSEPDEYTWSYFTGFTVSDANAGTLGRVTHVYDETANVLLEVDGPDGSYLIPAAEPFILEIDAQSRHLLMQLPDGLLDL